MTQKILLDFDWPGDETLRGFQLEFAVTHDAAIGRYNLIQVRIRTVKLHLSFKTWIKGHESRCTADVALAADTVWTDAADLLAIERWAEDYFWDRAEAELIRRHDALLKQTQINGRRPE